MAEKVKKQQKTKVSEERLPDDAEQLLAAILGVSLEEGTDSEQTSGKASEMQQEQVIHRTVANSDEVRREWQEGHRQPGDVEEVSEMERVSQESTRISDGGKKAVCEPDRTDGLVDTGSDGREAKANRNSGGEDVLTNATESDAAMVLSPSWSIELAPHITGTMVNYYFVCQRKLWFFTHHLECEHDSDLVRMGKLLHQYSYMREEKEIDIDQRIVLDWYDRERNVVCEVKSSDHQEEAHRWQVLFYLWYLKSKGMQVARSEEELQRRPHQRGTFGELRYPKQKQRSVVVLTPELERELETEILPKIFAIANSETVPKRERKAICSPCAYYELCFVEEPKDKAEE